MLVHKNAVGSRREHKSNRWSPRLSIRALAVFVTLVCAYLGAWQATKKYGVPAVEKNVHDPVFIDQDGKKVDLVFVGSSYYYNNPNAPAPFVVTVQRYNGADILVDANGDRDVSTWSPHVRRTCLWFFGFIYPRETIYLPAKQI